MYFYLISASILLVAALTLEVIYREHLFKHLKARIVWIFVFLLVGIIWDTYGLIHGHWVFTGKGILGIYIGVLPLEDFLWFLAVPYFCLTVYKTVHIVSDKK
jgi:lycopene cyclase domain-containing protein